MNSSDPSPFMACLLPLSFVYGGAAFLRRRIYDREILKPRRLACPVISIGNITAGGTGKTPMTVYLATLLKEMGLSPAVVSRGYAGSRTGKGGIVSDGRQILMDVGRAGDEPYLMARRLTDVPVAVGRRRYLIAEEVIRRFSPGVILLDDGFQHFQLARDLDILLLDQARPLGNGRLLPAGPLREPLITASRADIFIFTRSDRTDAAGAHPARLKDRISGKPCFKATHVSFVSEWFVPDRTRPDSDPPPSIDKLAGRRAFVFCGLADNRAFLHGIGQLSAEVAGYRFFPDHQAYAAADVDDIIKAARRSGADLIVTSAKDYVKCRNMAAGKLPCELCVLDVAISFGDDSARFSEMIRDRFSI